MGDGPERKRLEDLIKELGLSKQIKLPGQVVNPYPFIVKADALVLSSFYEGLPNVILESLALQTPVIATPAGGVCKELLADRVGCVLAKDVSDRAIAEAISYWIESAPHIIDEDAVKLFDAPMIVKRYESIFASVVP